MRGLYVGEFVRACLGRERRNQRGALPPSDPVRSRVLCTRSLPIVLPTVCEDVVHVITQKLNPRQLLLGHTRPPKLCGSAD